MEMKIPSIGIRLLCAHHADKTEYTQVINALHGFPLELHRWRQTEKKNPREAFLFWLALVHLAVFIILFFCSNKLIDGALLLNFN